MNLIKIIILIVVTATSLILSCTRFYIVKNNFVHSIENASKQNANQHILEKYMLESNIVKSIQERRTNN